MSQSFVDFGLSEDLVSTINALGFEAPTELQAQAIPPVLAGRDLFGEAPAGTGITASYVWPLLQRLRAAPREPEPRAARILVLTPTRELALQAEDCARQSSGEAGLRTALMFGGVSPLPQVQALAPGVDLLAATTRRLLDHLAQGTVDLSKVDTLVVNVGERVLDTGFLRDVERIAEALPAERQVLVFAAGVTQELSGFAQRLLRDPVRIGVAAPAGDAGEGGQAADNGSGESAPVPARRESQRRSRNGEPAPERAPPRRRYEQANGNVAAPPERQYEQPNGNVAYAEDDAPRRTQRSDRQPASNENQLFPSSGAVYGHGPGQGARRGRRTGRGDFPYRD